MCRSFDEFDPETGYRFDKYFDDNILLEMVDFLRILNESISKKYRTSIIIFIRNKGKR